MRGDRSTISSKATRGTTAAAIGNAMATKAKEASFMMGILARFKFPDQY
jgi:hypothetical protein